MRVWFGSPITRYVALSIAGCLATVLVLVFIVYRRTSESFEQANIALLRQNVITVDSSLRAFMEGDPRNSVGFPKYMEKLRGTREVVEAEATAAIERFGKFQEDAKKSDSDLGDMAQHFKPPFAADQKLEYQLRIIPADVTRQSTLKNAMARIKSELQETPQWKDKKGPELDAATKAEYERLYPTADTIEKMVLENALAYEQWDEEASVFRMTVPVAAAKSCIDCHNVAREGQPLGAITVIHSLDRAQAMKAALTQEIGVIAAISTLALLALGLWNARSLQRVLVQVSGSIVGVSGRLRTHVRALHGANDAVAGGVSRQREAMQKTHEAVGQMTEISQQAASNARNSTTLIGNVDSALTDSAAIVKRMNESMDDIRKASNEVSSITRVINEIAFKTNLLAINAAIEAARAGDAGRGFAVVADEVRTLARRSAEAATEVDTKIAAAIEKSSTSARISSELLATFEKARQCVGESRTLISRIMDETQRQSSSASEHQTAVNGVEVILDETVSDARSAEEAARKLEIESETLEASLDSLRKLMSVNTPQFKPELRPTRAISTVMPARA